MFEVCNSLRLRLIKGLSAPLLQLFQPVRNRDNNLSIPLSVETIVSLFWSLEDNNNHLRTMEKPKPLVLSAQPSQTIPNYVKMVNKNN